MKNLKDLLCLRKKRLGLVKKFVFLLSLLAMSANADMIDLSGSGSASGSGSSSGPDSNETLRCSAKGIQGPVELPYPSPLTILFRILITIFYILVIFAAILLNSFVVYLIAKFKQLRNIEFAIAIQLVLINIVTGILTLPPGAISAVANQWLLSEPVCIGVAAIYHFVGLTRSLLLSAFVIDRFCMVFMPFLYPKFRVKVLISMIVAMYAVSVSVPTISAVFDCYSFSFTIWICRFTPQCGLHCGTIRLISGFFVFTVLCSVLPVVLYVILYCKARRAMTSQGGGREVTKMEAERQRRATVTFFLMFLALFLIIIPNGIVSLIVSSPSIAATPDTSLWLYMVDIFTLNIFTLVYITDPIFLLRNKDVRDVVAKVSWIPNTLKCNS